MSRNLVFEVAFSLQTPVLMRFFALLAIKRQAKTTPKAIRKVNKTPARDALGRIRQALDFNRFVKIKPWRASFIHLDR